MEGNGEEVFIAEGREERVHYSKSYVIKKKHLRMASLLGKIVTKTSNPADPAIEELGADDAAEHNVDHQDFSKGEFKCPFLHLGFTIQRENCSKKGKELGSDDEENTFYTDKIVFAKQEVVSRSLISNKLVAAQYHKSSRVDYPDPLPLSSSMASFEDRKWNKFGIQKQVLPSNLISDCLQSVISTDQWNKSGQTQSGQINLESIETIGIICGERFGFKRRADLNKHVHNRHGNVDLFDLPTAVSTDVMEEDRREYEEENGIVRRCPWIEVHEFDSQACKTFKTSCQREFPWKISFHIFQIFLDPISPIKCKTHHIWATLK